MNDIERSIITSLTEISIIKDTQLIDIDLELLKLSAGIRDEDIDELYSILNNFRDKENLLENWKIVNNVIIINLSKKLPIPKASITEKYTIKDRFYRRVLLFKLYQAYFKDGKHAQFPLASLSNLLGIDVEEIRRHVNYLDDEYYLEYKLADGGMCTSNLTIEGIKLCENRAEIFEQFSAIKAYESNKNYESEGNADTKKLFVVHGRNELARRAIFDFLRSIDLKPIEWSEALALTKQGAPYIGDVLDKAFSEAQAVIVLLTGDDLARIGTRFILPNENKEELSPQARPNVLFEAGMAFGRHPERTILVQIGNIRNFSDIAGRHIIYLNNSVEKRQELIDRLKIAGCNVDISNKRDWVKTGDFDKCAVYPDENIDNSNELSQKKISPLKKLDDIEVDILKNLSVARDKGIKYLTSSQLSNYLNVTPTKINYYLKRLEQNEFIYGSYVMEEQTKYSIDQKGSEYLIKHNLI